MKKTTLASLFWITESLLLFKSLHSFATQANRLSGTGSLGALAGTPFAVLVGILAVVILAIGIANLLLSLSRASLIISATLLFLTSIVALSPLSIPALLYGGIVHDSGDLLGTAGLLAFPFVSCYALYAFWPTATSTNGAPVPVSTARVSILLSSVAAGGMVLHGALRGWILTLFDFAIEGMLLAAAVFGILTILRRRGAPIGPGVLATCLPPALYLAWILVTGES